MPHNERATIAVFQSYLQAHIRRPLQLRSGIQTNHWKKTQDCKLIELFMKSCGVSKSCREDGSNIVGNGALLFEHAEAHQIFRSRSSEEELQWQVAEVRLEEDGGKNGSAREEAVPRMMSRASVRPTQAAFETTTEAQQTTIIRPSSTTTTSSSMRPPEASMSRLFWLLWLFVATCSGQEVQLGRPGGARIKAGAGDWPASSVSLARTSSTSSSVQNVTAQNGQSVLLHCVVEPPSESGVSWFRGASEPQLLTSESHTVIDDERFVVRRGLMADDDWALQIKNLDKSSDAGLYQCQTHSEPPRSQFYQLNIVEPQAHIAGAPDMAVKLGAAINLTCLITQLSDEMPFIFWYHNQQIINKRLSDSGRGKIVISKLASADGSAKSHSMAATLYIFHSLLADSGNYTCLPPGSGRPTSIYVHVLEGSNKRLIMFQNDQQYAPASDLGLAPPASSQQTNSAISVHVWRLTRGRAYALFVSLVIFSAWYQLLVQTPMLFSFLLLAIIGFFLGLVTDSSSSSSSNNGNLPANDSQRKGKSCPSDGQVAPTLDAHSTATSPTTTATDSALHLLKSASSGSENSLLATATTDLSATSSYTGNRTTSQPAGGALASPSTGSTSSSASTGYNSDARSSTRTSHRKPGSCQEQEPQESNLDDATTTSTAHNNSNPDHDMIELVTQPTALRLIMDEFSSARLAQCGAHWSPISASNSLEKASQRKPSSPVVASHHDNPSSSVGANFRSSAEPIGFNWLQSPIRQTNVHKLDQQEPHYSTPTLNCRLHSPQMSPHNT